MTVTLTSKQYKNISALVKIGRRRDDELRLHKSVVDYINRVMPGHAGFHVPNGERRDARTAAKLKSMGTRAGVPDYCFPCAGGRVLWMEFKAPGGKLSQVQRVFIGLLRDLGHTVAIVESVDDVRNTFRAYGVQTREAK